jgi:hypothetical protein
MKMRTTLIAAVLIAGLGPAWVNAQPDTRYSSKLAVLGQLRTTHLAPAPPAPALATVSSRLALLKPEARLARVPTPSLVTLSEYNSRTALLGQRETVVELAPLK